MGGLIIDVIGQTVNIFATLRKSCLLGEHEKGSETDPGFHERRFVCIKILGLRNAVCPNIVNGIEPGSDPKTTDKYDANCSKAV